LDSELLGLVTF